MKLSKNFTLGELTATAVRLPNQPDILETENLVFLANRILEPVRSAFGPLHTTSGYRSMEVNKVIGGSPYSEHIRGCAWDGIPTRDNEIIKWRDIIGWLIKSDLPVDQVIYEFGRWIHIGTRPRGEGCRKQALMIFTAGKYEVWNPTDERVSK